MSYQTVSQDDQDDTLVLFLASQERDHNSHTVNKVRYESMLTTLSAGLFRDRITQLLGETDSRLADVNAIIAATVPQMPSAERVAASLVRLKAKGML